jgi:hypothetical protein
VSPLKPSFIKRDREKKLVEKARLKAERREARKASPSSGHGPPIEADPVDEAPVAETPADPATPPAE